MRVHRTEPIDGNLPWKEAAEKLRAEIDAGYPAACLILKHKNPKMEDFVWHWFLLIGYETDDEKGHLSVKTVTYSEAQWLDFEELWETGYREKGGLVLLRRKSRP